MGPGRKVFNYCNGKVVFISINSLQNVSNIDMIILKIKDINFNTRSKWKVVLNINT